MSDQSEKSFRNLGYDTCMEGVELPTALRDLAMTRQERREFRRGYRLAELDQRLDAIRQLAHELKGFEFDDLLEGLKMLNVKVRHGQGASDR